MARKETDGGGGTPNAQPVTFDQFFAAIAGQESGGNYDAINARTGASGKYQIMPANIGPWSEQYLGHRVSVDQFRSSPALQEELARAVLYDYYGKYGARGAASAWYSGSPKGQNNYNRFNANEPSIGEYVDQVLGRAVAIDPNAAATGQPTSRDVSTTATTTDATTKASDPSTLGPQGDANYKPGVSEFQAAGAQAVVAPGTGAVEAAGTQGLDRQAVTAGLDGEVAPPASPTGPTTTTTKSTSQVLAAATPEARQQVIDYLKQALGTPYVWGGQGPGGFDCSGLIYWAMKSAGLKPPPRLSQQQLQVGGKEDWSQLQAGDFIGYNGGAHIAVYLGNNQLIEAPHTGLNVRIRDVTDYDRKNGWGVDASSLYG
jgi:cell wall-associated NlpC family hydrolase